MSDHDREDLKAIKTFPSLVKYLRDELDWPIDREDFEDLVFDYEAEELGIDAKTAAKIDGIKQLRPLVTGQPWGIFFVKFEPKRLPVVALRRILSKLVFKKRASANRAEQATWAMNDLLFISAYGEDAHRQITFAHFAEDRETSDLPTLKVLGWDDQDTALHLDHVADELHEKLCWPDEEDDLEAWRQQWSSAFTLRHREVITTSKQLALRLAELARSIRSRVNAVLAIETDTGPMTKLMAAFREALIHDLEADDFADMYAQTIAYGLLSARISRPAGLVAENVADMVPITNPFLKELMVTFLHLGGRRNGRGQAAGLDFDELGINDVVELLRNANMEAVLRDFDNLNPAEDPVIHFYESFLKEYDAKKRMRRGVFYTPKPVVSFIVRSVHELLQTEFGLEDGLASTVTWGEMAERHKDLTIPEGTEPDSPFVVILDPATGTATFLVEAIDVIYRSMKAKWLAAGHMALEIPKLWNKYVPRHLLPRLHGYELLMAPYAIAHMKIGLKLSGTGYQFDSDERARIYLTNALEPPQDFSDTFEQMAPALAHEAQAVNDVKRRQQFTVVIGNPPYSGISSNLTPTARALVDRYRFIDGAKLREKGALQFEKNLQDDYVKFLALAEERIANARAGVLGFITNNGYLDTPTLRGLRWNLLQTFDDLRLLDLHGSTKRPLPGDENVFDIQQGVAICLLSRRPSPRDVRVERGDIIGDRTSKYTTLSGASTLELDHAPLKPKGELFVFLALDDEIQAEYAAFVPLTAIMPHYASGTETGFDDLLVAFSRDELRERLKRFLRPELSLDAAREEFGVNKGNSLRLFELRDEFRRDFHQNGTAYETVGMYRPFDNRIYYYRHNYFKTNSFSVMRHLISKSNVALVAFRQQSQRGFQHAFVTDTLGDKNAVSLRTREVNYYFPMYLYPEPDSLKVTPGRIPNVSNEVTALIRRSWYACDGEGDAASSPRDIFMYVYGVLHSPIYRERYEEFLRMDFPRIPLPGTVAVFQDLVTVASGLVALHLLESPLLDEPITAYTGPANPDVEKVNYANNTVWLDKTQTRGFKGVPEEVWNFHIGGYQVCQKWLKDRQAKGGKNPRPGRVLTDEDIDHYQKIVVALHETIRIMAEIDKVIDQHGGWPDAFVTEPREK